MSELVKIGKREFSLRHLSVFRIEEIVNFLKIKEERARELLDRAMVAVRISMITPTILRVKNIGYNIPVGVSLVHDSYNVLTFDPKPFRVPELFDDEFLDYLLFNLPKKLDTFRVPVLVEDLDERFTRNIREGILYALDMLDRICKSYLIQAVCTGSILLKDYFQWRSVLMSFKDPELGMACAVLKPSYAVYKI